MRLPWAWRTTQGVYCFDNDLFREVLYTLIQGEIPTEILFHLPEWCVFIATPDVIFIEKELLGFFASLDYCTHTNGIKLVLMLRFNDAARSIIKLDLKGSLAESVDFALHQAEQGSGFHDKIQRDNLIHILRASEGLLSLTLYLASQNQHIEHLEGNRKPEYAIPVKTKKGMRFFPPDKATTWGVGFRLGAALRDARVHQEAAGEQASILKASSRPHIRRAHWHTYWTGAKTTAQTPVLK